MVHVKPILTPLTRYINIVLILRSRGTVEGGSGFQWADQVVMTLETRGQEASNAGRHGANLL